MNMMHLCNHAYDLCTIVSTFKGQVGTGLGGLRGVHWGGKVQNNSPPFSTCIHSMPSFHTLLEIGPNIDDIACFFPVYPFVYLYYRVFPSNLQI